MPEWESYQVSDQGKVYSKYSDKLLRSFPDKDGYLRVNLSQQGERLGHVAVHLLVLLAFVGPRPEGLECCHNDGVHTNNLLHNLRYDTVSANKVDRYNHGFRGEALYSAKLTEKAVRDIRSTYTKGKVTLDTLAEKYGVTKQAVWLVLKRKSWRHVT